MASFNFTIATPNEGTLFTFGSWICITNERGGFNSHLVDPGSRRHLLQHHAGHRCIHDGFGRIQLSDLIGSYASRLKAISLPRISNDDLLAGIDWVDSSIVGCIKLVEAALQCSDD
jgi:hypothetical protein